MTNTKIKNQNYLNGKTIDRQQKQDYKIRLLTRGVTNLG